MNTETQIPQLRNGRGRRASVTSAARLAGLLSASAAAVLVTAVSAGCQHHDEPVYVGQKEIGGDLFPARGDTHAVERFNDTQAASAARTDATLRPYHFDGAELNSLGQNKLELMTRDDRAFAPFVVYLDFPQEANLDARRESVLVFLKDHGLKDDQIHIKAGPNESTDNVHPVAQSIRSAHQLDAGGAVGTNPEPSNSAAAAAAH